MKKADLFFGCFVTVMMVSSISWAQTEEQQSVQAVAAPVVVTPVAEEALALNDEICGFIIEHQPVTGVEYQPGIDVHGKPVVEAETDSMTGSVAVRSGEELSFDIKIDLAKYAGLQVPEDAVDMEKIVGTVTYKNGLFSFNGKPFLPENDAAMRALCAPKPEVTPAKAP